MRSLLQEYHHSINGEKIMSTKSAMLVLSQFILILFIVLHPSRPYSSSAISLVLMGICLGVWVISYNKINNFNIQPELKKEAKLITDGPYRIIRHPMYTALLLVMLGVSLSKQNTFVFFAWALLMGILWVKSRLEEQYLIERWPLYTSYRESTYRFIPLIW
jgi:protein-S-isoprenylcysteine O-methyltransferase Ste14